MERLQTVYRYLTLVLAVDIALQFFLAGAGVFRAHGPKPARDSSAFDPHRANGDAVMVVALLVLLTALAARNRRWRVALPLTVLAVIQTPLSISGWAGGLHPLNGLLITALAAFLAHDAWAGARRAARGA